MTSYDITWGQQNKWELGEAPIIPSISVNASNLSIIYKCVTVIEGKEWLDHATNLAMGEMISDVDEALKEAKAAVESARKLIPFHYRYLINPFNSWLQKLK
jgi:hypothetical protein